MTPHEFLAIRHALSLSQAQLGRQLGKHRNTVAAYESGMLQIPVAVAHLLPYLLKKEGKQ